MLTWLLGSSVSEGLFEPPKTRSRRRGENLGAVPRSRGVEPAAKVTRASSWRLSRSDHVPTALRVGCLVNTCTSAACGGRGCRRAAPPTQERGPRRRRSTQRRSPLDRQRPEPKTRPNLGADMALNHPNPAHICLRNQENEFFRAGVVARRRYRSCHIAAPSSADPLDPAHWHHMIGLFHQYSPRRDHRCRLRSRIGTSRSCSQRWQR